MKKHNTIPKTLVPTDSLVLVKGYHLFLGSVLLFFLILAIVECIRRYRTAARGFEQVMYALQAREDLMWNKFYLDAKYEALESVNKVIASAEVFILEAKDLHEETKRCRDQVLAEVAQIQDTAKAIQNRTATYIGAEIEVPETKPI